MAWGLGLEPRFSDSKSDVLPIRQPPNTEWKWLGDQESNLDFQIQSLMSYQLDDPQNQSAPAGPCLLGRLSRRQTTPAFNDMKARYIIRCWPIFISDKHNHLSRPRQAPRLSVYIVSLSHVDTGTQSSLRFCQHPAKGDEIDESHSHPQIRTNRRGSPIRRCTGA